MYTAHAETIAFGKRSRAIATLVALAMLAAIQVQPVGASDETKTPAVTPLSVDQIVDNLVRKNTERARSLLHSQSTRIYHLSYRGFPGNREAEMTVEASYDSPANKEFKIVSQSGSKIILERVFAKLLEAEKESVRPEIASASQLNRENYEFELVGYKAAEAQYELQIVPKHKSRYAYRGKIWVDARDFAVTHIEAEPAQNPSFWTKRSEIHHEYQKIQNSWVPAKNESVSYVRLGGSATLTIEYKDYRLTEAQTDVAATSSSSEGIAPAH